MAELDQNRIPALLLGKTHRDEIIEIAELVFPQEACGIIAGKDQVSHKILPITNILASHTAYQMDPVEMVNAFYNLEEASLEAVAFFHSHPHSLPIPSATDLELNYYPETPQVILGRPVPAEDWIIKGYYLFPDRYEEIPVHII